jgi:phosphatidylglycerol lysyltransferase
MERKIVLRENFVAREFGISYINDIDFTVVEKDEKIYEFFTVAKSKNKHETSCEIVRYVKCNEDVFLYMILKMFC